MGKLTVRVDQKEKILVVNEGQPDEQVYVNDNGFLNCGIRKCENEIAYRILQRNPHYPENAYRAAYLMVKAARETRMTFSVTVPDLPVPEGRGHLPNLYD